MRKLRNKTNAEGDYFARFRLKERNQHEELEEQLKRTSDQSAALQRLRHTELKEHEKVQKLQTRAALEGADLTHVWQKDQEEAEQQKIIDGFLLTMMISVLALTIYQYLKSQ